eukprot:3108954-Amphidinium_carterae.1
MHFLHAILEWGVPLSALALPLPFNPSKQSKCSPSSQLWICVQEIEDHIWTCGRGRGVYASFSLEGRGCHNVSIRNSGLTLIPTGAFERFALIKLIA